MNAFKALALLALVSTVGSLAQAATIGSNIRASSCEIITPFHLTKAETLQLESKGYHLTVKRSDYSHSRFLGIYEYYEAKQGHFAPGQIYVRPVLAPNAMSAVSFSAMPVSTVPKRELSFNVQTVNGPSMFEVASSAPEAFSKDEFQQKNANLDKFPACQD